MLTFADLLPTTDTALTTDLSELYQTLPGGSFPCTRTGSVPTLDQTGRESSVNAEITLIPVMNADDVAKGIEEAAKTL